MTKRSFVIGEFISDMSHGALIKLMPCGSRKNERVNDLAFVIGEFINDMSHGAWIKLMPCGSRKNERVNDLARRSFIIVYYALLVISTEHRDERSLI